MMKSIIELLYGSSLRISEAEGLKLDDISFDTGSILVTDFKNDGRQWKAPASEASLRYLKVYLKQAREVLLTDEELAADYLYPQKGKTAIRCMLNNKLKRECRRLGLKPITTHSFRHSSATHMLRSGAGIRQVQCMLGHSRINTTQRYTRVIKEDLKTVMDRFHPRSPRQEAKP
jgi:integrase/recombinase XerD